MWGWAKVPCATIVGVFFNGLPTELWSGLSGGGGSLEFPKQPHESRTYPYSDVLEGPHHNNIASRW